jgi:class 3 adenylate cyclase
MGLKEDLISEVNQTFATKWEEQKTTDVPDPENLQLKSNHAKYLEGATVLYADIDDSTSIVDKFKWFFSAGVYKAYLRCAGQIIRSENGTITAYDGDRIMAVFTGGSKNTNAVRAALKINYSVVDIIRPAIKNRYPKSDFLFKHVIGIDSSQLHTARIGVHGDNDLVWIGRAANYAAKLCTLSDKPVWITNAVYDKMSKEVKFSNSINMWTPHKWTAMNEMEIFATTYHWKL